MGICLIPVKQFRAQVVGKLSRVWVIVRFLIVRSVPRMNQGMAQCQRHDDAFEVCLGVGDGILDVPASVPAGFVLDELEAAFFRG